MKETMSSETKTTKSSGRINVQTENIFPIIKKFLYSDHEIFLRELVSNAVDAGQKLKALSSMGKVEGELGHLRVEVVLDEAAKTITIKDNGIGMSAEEVEKYINQIAFSGAEEFVSLYKDKIKDNSIIGHFGLGFYSAFMVAKNVEIISKSYQKDKPAIHWECDGSPDYTLTPHERTERGTDIILHLADDSLEFSDTNRLNGILTKYCKFLPVEIKFGTTEKTNYAERDKDGNKIGEDTTTTIDNIINNPNPAWVKKPSELTEDNYNDFYRELYPMSFEQPLFNIHLNVDYPFNLTGVLYFPAIKPDVQVQKNKIQLYCNQVFVTDSVEGIVPEFLTLLHGVIDSPDIPLNVSRSYLQSDSNVKKISSHITKKVADKLEELFKADRADFEKKWDDIKIFIEYGMLSDEKFYDRAAKFYLLKDTDSKYYTLEEYKEFAKTLQTNKDSKVIWLYANDSVEQYSYINKAAAKGYNVLLIDGPFSSHLVGQLEQKMEDVSLSRVDADTLDKLIQKEEAPASLLTKEQEEKVKGLFEAQVEKPRFSVSIESLSPTDNPVVITEPEFMRRMKDMQRLQGGGLGGMFPDTYQLVVNANHPSVSALLGAEEDAAKDKVKQLIDLSLLAKNLLKGEALEQFISRSVSLMN
jgi:molecular chaperone HtpG